MGLLFVRRRPLLRGAMLAGAGAAVYSAGKRRQAAADHEYAQDAQLAATAPPQQGESGPSASQVREPAADPIAQLERLKALLDQGALTESEYEMAKKKVLQA